MLAERFGGFYLEIRMQWGIQTPCGMSAQELVVFIDQKHSDKLLKVIIFKRDLHIKREIVVDSKL